VIDCSNVKKYAPSISLIEDCDQVSGALRLLTPFQYPNGAKIDLFLREGQPLFDGYVLTDLGQSTGYLLDVNVKPWATNKRRQIVEDVCRSLDVVCKGGEFQIELDLHEAKDFSQPMMRLVQACIRISDLAFSARLWAAGSFKDELEEFLQGALEVQYETDIIEVGRNREDVKLDFRVHGERMTSLILTLSAASTFSAHNAANEVCIRWLDLGKRKADQQYITVLDESHEVFKARDLNRIAGLSNVIAFPTEQDQLKGVLAA
jgi:hypothetical protein